MTHSGLADPRVTHGGIADTEIDVNVLRELAARFTRVVLRTWWRERRRA